MATKRKAATAPARTADSSGDWSPGTRAGAAAHSDAVAGNGGGGNSSNSGASGLDAAASEASLNASIYQDLLTAIMEHRLLAGTKLVEERLCEVTGASRARIRQVFARLAHEKLVTLIPNRGAFISSPTVEEARQVFQARRMVERELAGLLATQATAAQIRTLRRHVQQEDAARARNDRAAVIRLSGAFHIVLAELAGNAILEKLVREMVSLTCLIITLYDRPGAPACPEHEHRDLIDAIEQRDAARAEALMADHLRHIEGSLDLTARDNGAPDFHSIFHRE
ncbi:GntR family transcriptional regulator [Cupriavidus sp. Marseille-Q8015]